MEDSPSGKDGGVDPGNKLAALGLERDWSLNKNFSRRRMPVMSKPEKPDTKEYLPSI